MDPNQNNPTQPPVPQEPVIVPPAAAPEIQPAVSAPTPQYFTAPVVEYPQQPQPQPMNPISVAPTPQPIVQAPVPVNNPQVIGSSPQPFVANVQPNMANDLGNNVNKKQLKLFLIISAILLAVVGVGVAVWLMFFNKIALEEYSNSDYSISVPKSYKKDDFGSSVEFTKPDTKYGYESEVKISTIEIPDGMRSEFIDEMDKIITEDKVKSGDGMIITSQEISNVKIVSSENDGVEKRVISGSILDDKKVAKTFKMAIIFSSDKVYSILIIAHTTESNLASSADTIINSFKEK